MPAVSPEVVLLWLGVWLVLLAWGYWESAYAGHPVTVWVVLGGSRASEWVEGVMCGLEVAGSYGFRITRIVVADAARSDQVIRILERLQRRGYEFNYRRLDPAGLSKPDPAPLAVLVTEDALE